jgi:hypothetical protein
MFLHRFLVVFIDAAPLALPDSVTQLINGSASLITADVAPTPLSGLPTLWTTLHLFSLVVNGSVLVGRLDIFLVPLLFQTTSKNSSLNGYATEICFQIILSLAVPFRELIAPTLELLTS